MYQFVNFECTLLVISFYCLRGLMHAILCVCVLQQDGTVQIRKDASKSKLCSENESVSSRLPQRRKMRSPLFWDVTWRRLLVSYRCVGQSMVK